MSFKIVHKRDRQEHSNQSLLKNNQKDNSDKSGQIKSDQSKQYEFTLFGLEQQYQCLQGAAECLSLYGQSSQFIVEGVSGSGKHFLLKKVFEPFQESANVVYVDAGIQNTQEIINEIVKASKQWQEKNNNRNQQKINKKVKGSSEILSSKQISNKNNIAKNQQSYSQQVQSSSVDNDSMSEEVLDSAAQELYGRHWALSGALAKAKLTLIIFQYELLSSELLYALSDRQHTCSQLLLILVTCKYCQETYLGLRVRSRLTAEKLIMQRDMQVDEVAFKITIQQLNAILIGAGKQPVGEMNIPLSITNLIKNKIQQNLVIQSGFHFVRNLALEAFLTIQSVDFNDQNMENVNVFNYIQNIKQLPRFVNKEVLSNLNRRFNFQKLSKECLWLLSFCFMSQEKSEKAVKSMISQAPSNILTEQQKFILSNSFTELQLCGVISYLGGRNIGKFKINCGRQSVLAAITSAEMRSLFSANKPVQPNLNANLLKQRLEK